MSIRIKVMKAIFLLLCFFYTGIVFPQTVGVDPQNVPTIFPPSPNAASLGIYGQIPVSLFNGLAQINIPIGNLSVNEANFDISLNYHGGGIRPDQHAGWTGLGWDLNAGGVITRKMNDGMDEFLTTPEIPSTKYGYYYNYFLGDTSNWYSTALLNYSNPMQNFAHPSADEFIFNFGKYSGSFFYNHKGKWQVKSTDPISLKVQEELKDDFSLASSPYGRGPIILKRIFYKFTLTTPDGCKYIFGGTPESIEFTRDAGESPFGDGYHANVVASSWNLTKVITSKGQEITFIYERDGINATVSSNLVRYHYKNGVAQDEDAVSLNQKNCSIINPSYLTTIIAPNQTIAFSRSISNELLYSYEALLKPSDTYEDLTRSESSVDIENDIHWMKLDSISFYSTDPGFLKKIAFYYKEQPTSRLRLDSIKEIGSTGITKPSYQFTYDATPLPAYNVQQLDHWGYYNGRNFFALNPRNNIADYVKGDIPAYTTSRNSDLTLMRAGILTSIKYPTGGTTTLQYEPHEYAKIAKRFPFVVSDTNANVPCGGLRIRKIINSDALGNAATTKEYKYVLNYNSGGNVSSGILAGYPQYLDEGQLTGMAGTTTYWYWYDFSIEPMSFTDGNHITYSEVSEKLNDGSFTIYKFANHNSPQSMDTSSLMGIYSANLQWNLDPNTSKALERGKLLDKRDYNASGILLKKTNYEYDTSSTKYNEAIRMVNLRTRTFGDGNDRRVTSYLIYTYPRFLTKEIDTIWDQNGGNPLRTVQSHQYNGYRLKAIDSSGNSMGDTLKVTYKYPFDMIPGSDPTGIYQKMVDSNLIEPVIEQRKFLNGTQINLVRTNYYSPFTKIYVPQTVEVQNKSFPVETRLRYQAYDGKGNIVGVSKENDLPASYIWNYSQMLPVAEVKNALPADIAYTSFESDGTGNWNAYTGTISTAAAGNLPPTGNKYYNLTPSVVLIKTGLTAAKTYIVSYWTKNSVAFTIPGAISGYPKQGKTINGWTYFEHQVTGQTSVTLSGTGTLDEVRLYPNTAQMTTYAYFPVIGTSSICDVNNRMTYYEYDGLSRLNLVRDQDWNVIKKIGYKFYNQPGDGEFSNSQQTFSATKSTCPIGQSGSLVTYIVPEGKYVSTKGKAYVDSLAGADGNANKQTYADNNGFCTALPVTVTISGYNGGSVIVYFRSASHTYHIQAGGGNSLITIPWDTYNITCEVKSGSKITFSLNGVLKTDSFAIYNNVDIHSASSILMGVYGNTIQTITKQRSNCNAGELPSSVTYTVPANTYVSTLSLPDANTQAINVSQTAAQNYANANGTCTVIPTTTSIIYTNDLAKKVTLTLTNVSTSVVYTFTLNITNTPTTAGSVPTGNYNVIMTANGPSTSYSINSYVQNIPDTDLNLTNIPLNTATTTVAAHR
ncbi:DUF5977 domain-containing protein [Flavitalea flava]